jgi:2'-5' RNA ligase
MTKTPEAVPWGSLALVCYIPDPLGSFLHSLRKLLPGEEHPLAHITILPPRPLKLSLEAALQKAEAILDRFSPFEVHLSDVHCFPGTKVLYLDIADGEEPLHEMHDALNRDDLEHEEPFEFRPHLTIGGPVAPEELEPVKILAEKTWQSSQHSPGFIVEEIIGLWSPASAAVGDWQRLWNYRLKPSAGRTSINGAVGTSQTS